MSAWLDALRKGKDELVEALIEGWEKLQRRSSAGLTRFTRHKDTPSVDGMPDSDESWGLLSAEVFDGEKELVVRLEAPGMNREDFDLTVERGCLYVRGEKRFERTQDHGHYHLFESAYGAFERVIPLPTDVTASEAEASYKQGVLTVTLPKAASVATSKISIHD